MALYYSWIIFIATKILIFLQNPINYVEENLTLAAMGHLTPHESKLCFGK